MEEAIAAIATPSVPSAIGIIRLSGAGCVDAVAGLFTPAHGGALQRCAPGRLVYGTLHDKDGAQIDKVLATYSLAPASYTGEDTAELQCHGSPAVLALALEGLFAHGVRQAGPGEFTRRAFLNGKLDLAQAEGVIDLIQAQTTGAVRCAAGHLAGALSQRVDHIYTTLVDLLAHFHAVLDYPDEDIDPFRKTTIHTALTASADGLTAMLATYARGRHLTDGVPCAILGRPNVGKSSLLNALVGYDRAIVTPLPGTTRDTVEERCTLSGVLLRLVDTAGLRQTADEVERLGVERSLAAVQEAQLVLAVVDGSTPLTPEDAQVLERAGRAPHAICVVSKSDLPSRIDQAGLAKQFPYICPVSALTGEGLTALEDMVGTLFAGAPQSDEAWLTNPRQFAAATVALEAVTRAQQALEAGLPPDVLLLDVEAALEALAALTGKQIHEDVVSRIFERFCVGK